MYTSKERLHLSRDGRVVKPGDPTSISLLVNEGGQISDEVARKYGLIPGGSKQDGMLPLEELPTSPQASGLSVSQEIQELENAYPKSLQFGGTKAAPPVSPVVTDTSTQPPVSPPPPFRPPDEVKLTPATPVADADLPPTFPHRTILVNQGMGKLADVMNATKDQLIALELIGTQRADEIIEAREKLRE